MPKRSSFSSAYSRHSLRTSHDPQIFLASRVDPPFSGERLGVGLRAERVGLPCERVAVIDGADTGDPESDGVDEPVVGDSGVVLR